MKLSRWLWRLNTVGAIAVANLMCFGLCGLLHMSLFPERIVHVDVEPRWKLNLDLALTCGMLSLAFPAGWVSLLVCSVGPPWAALVFVPMNGYVLGAIGQRVWRLRATAALSYRKWKDALLHRKPKPGDSADFAATGHRTNPVAGRAPRATANGAGDAERAPLWFILIAGVVGPVIVGSSVLGSFAYPKLALAAGGVLVGACFVLVIVRRVNGRDDPHRSRHSTPPPAADSDAT